MISLLVPLAALASPLYVLDDPEIGTWALASTDPEEVARIAALANGPWVGVGPYVRPLTLDRLGELRVGGVVTGTADDGAPVACAITGFGFLQHAYDDGERRGSNPDFAGCSAPGLWARLDCAGTAPGAVASTEDQPPILLVRSEVSPVESERALAALRGEIDAFAVRAEPTGRAFEVTRWALGPHAWLLVQVDAWEGVRHEGCGSDGWAGRGWAVLDAATLAVDLPFRPVELWDRPDALLDADRDGRVEVLVRRGAGDTLEGPGKPILSAPRAICVCTC